MRLGGVAITVAVLAAAGCGASTKTVTQTQTATSSAVPAATQVRIYTPVSAATGSPTVHITARPKGYCWTTSDSVSRSAAWHCFVGNFIHDPCFTGPVTGSGHTVVCPNSGPWSGTAIEIRLTRPLPEVAGEPAREGTSGLPWALQLVDGSDCQLLNGASSVVDGMRFNYTCTPDKLDLAGRAR